MRLLNQLSIRSKLAIMLLAVSCCSIFAIAYLGYRSGKSNLTERIFSQLTSLRASKAAQIESYFETLRNQTQTLSEDLTMSAAMREFNAAYQELEAAEASASPQNEAFSPTEGENPASLTLPPDLEETLETYYREEFLERLARTQEGSPVLESYLPKTFAARYLQYHYIAANANPVGEKHLLNDPGDGSNYSRIHERYHPIFRNIVEKLGYYNMFLIAPETGEIVYSFSKETEFATSLVDGPYSESNLSQAAQEAEQAKEKDFVKTVDFKPYRPSYGVPAAFIATPIFDGSEFVGILAFQLPVEEINKVMTGNQNWKRDGLGNTGETYLVGSDYLMRSVSRFLVENPKGYGQMLRSLGVEEKAIATIEEFQTSILQQEVRTKAVEEALAGKQGTQIIQDYRGIPALISYAPLQIKGLEWAIFSEIDLSEAYGPLYSFQRQVLISVTSIVLLITLVALALAHVFIQPINALMASARQVEKGESETFVELESQDEFGELAKSFNKMVRSLRNQTELAEEQIRKNEKLLLGVFPAAIAQRLQRGERDIADEVSNVTILFSDITGFTELSETLTAAEVVSTLNEIVAAFDRAAKRYGIEKIKTIGDNYMAVCGLFVPHLDHSHRVLNFALEMRAIIRRFNNERNAHLDLKIGINTGTVIAGIVGRHKFMYEVWGRSVNIANSLQSLCPPGSVLVSQSVYDRLHDLYDFEQISPHSPNGKESFVAWKLNCSQRSLSV